MMPGQRRSASSEDSRKVVMMARNLAMGFALLAMPACEILGPGERSLAFLGDGGIAIGITVPDTVTRNVPFGVLIAYYGSSTCTRLDDVEVTTRDATVTIKPYVERPRRGVCTDDLRRFTVEPEVRISIAGPAQIHVMGRFDRRDTTVVRHTFVR